MSDERPHRLCIRETEQRYNAPRVSQERIRKPNNDDEKENLLGEASGKERTTGSVKRKAFEAQTLSPMGAQTWVEEASSTTAKDDDGGRSSQVDGASSHPTDHTSRSPKRRSKCNLLRKRAVSHSERQDLICQAREELDRTMTVANNEILAIIAGLQDLAATHSVMLDASEELCEVCRFRMNLDGFRTKMNENRKRKIQSNGDLIRRDGRALARFLKNGLGLRPGLRFLKGPF